MSPRDRRFGAARRKLHYRLRVMSFEHGQHCLTMDHNVKFCEMYAKRHDQFPAD